MPNRQVFLVEDEPMLRDGFKGWIEHAGHQVLLEASSLREALAKLDLIEFQQIEVAVLDGNLTKEATSGRDGEMIARAIRARFPNVKIMCLSAGRYAWGDTMFSKGDVFGRDGANPLGDAVSSA